MKQVTFLVCVIVVCCAAVPVDNNKTTPLFSKVKDQPKNTTTTSQKHLQLPTIAIVIPTMRRFTRDHSLAPQQYLKPLVSGIVGSLSEEQRKSVHLTLLNVDKQPDQHNELVDVVNSVMGIPITVITKEKDPIKSDVLDLPNLTPLGNGLFKDEQGREITTETRDWRSGETLDAPKLWLNAAKQAEYVLFLEDDVLPTTNVMTKIYSFLDRMKMAGKQDFLMVDLYTPAIEWGPKTVTNMEIYDYECCTQAMLFKSSRIPDLANYEFEHPQRPVDDNIRDYSRLDPTSRKIYAMVPNPFEHVGAYSSNPEKSIGVVEHSSIHFLP